MYADDKKDDGNERGIDKTHPVLSKLIMNSSSSDNVFEIPTAVFATTRQIFQFSF